LEKNLFEVFKLQILGGCLQFKLIWKTTYDNVKDVKAYLMWIA
jgi:hypothetical protein